MREECEGVGRGLEGGVGGNDGGEGRESKRLDTATKIAVEFKDM